MPSANPKLEKQASTEATDPIRQAITVIDHKIRNLEKRKSKLESYRDIQKTGKELNHDQKIAVAKYDEVLQTLEITRELSKQIIGIANDSAKQQKKIARKEALERMQQDISKVREVLLIQDVLMNMGGDSVREDFLTGANGATKLTKEDMKYLDDLFNEVTLKRQPENDELPFLQQAQKAAEHFVAIVEGKQREVFGTTYIKIKEIIASVNQSGYFDQTSVVENEVSGVVKTDEPVKVVNDSAEKTSEKFTGEVHIPAPESMIPITSYPVQVAPVAVVPGPTPVTGPIPVVAPQVIPPHATATIETSYYANAAGFVPPQQNQPPQNQQPPRINDVIGGTPNFFFLQESEIDSPEVSTQQQIAAHIPAVNPPIPTQTFTNPSFTGAPVQVPQQVIYTHPPQDMSHIPGFANPNPPPPIPMPPSHQQQSMQFSPQHQTSFPAQQGQMQQGFEQKDGQTQSTEENVEHHKKNPVSAIADAKCPNSNDWSQMTDSNQIEDWSAGDAQQSPAHNDQEKPQAWGAPQTSYRGRGGRRGNSNGYNGRGRGGGGYQQNGRGGSGQASYYRNENSNYQNGYQPRNYNNDGNAGYNGGFKRGGVGGPRGGPRGGGGERTGMDRGGRGGQFRGQRGGNRGGGGYIPRGKPQTQQ